MTDKAKLRDMVKKNVRALLISSPLGLSLKELERDYVDVIGDRIPALQLGFNSAKDLLLDMPDVASPRWERGDLVLLGVADSTTRHIQKLVSRQKKDKSKIQKKRAAINRRSQYSRYSRDPTPYQPPRRRQQASFSSRSFKAPAVKASVPASLQSQVKLILKKHSAGISNIEFEATFYQYQYFHINYKKLGFESLWEFFHEIPGVKTSHTSKDEYDIFLVAENIQAIPAGYEDRFQDVKESDFIYKRQVKPAEIERNRTMPTNSRCPWTLAGVPQPAKKMPFARGRVKNREEANTANIHNLTAKQISRVDSTSMPIEEDVDAPFEKEFVDDIKKILQKHPHGLWSMELPDEYKKLTGKPLKFFAMGYFSVVELVSAMPDVVTVVREDATDWKLYDAKTNRRLSIEGHQHDQDFTREDEGQSTLVDVKSRLRELLDDHGTGMLLEDLQSAYEAKYSRSIPLQKLGFQDIDSLILLIPDAVRVEYKGPGRVYAFPERATHGIPKYNSKMAALCSLPQDAVGFGYRFRDPEMPPLNDYVEVYVSSVYTPHKMTIQIRDKDQNLALEEMMDDLESIYKFPEGERYFFPVSMIAVNQLCCALYLEDNNWHRAMITGIVDNDFVEVIYVDYGSILQVPKSCLRLLKACFLKLPAMAIDARLANVEPLEEEWSSTARDRLLQLTMDKALIASCNEIKNKVLSLFLCDTSTDTDIHINDLLVQEEYARFSTPRTLPAAENDTDLAPTFDPSDFINPIQQLPDCSFYENTLAPADDDTYVAPTFDPSDFINPIQQLPDLGQTSEDHVPGGLLIQFNTDTGSHQVTATGDHLDEDYDREEEDDDESLIAHMNQELEGVADSESDSEEMEEIEESNLNLEDIELTMRFLVGRRKRLLAVLSSEEGVSAVDDLDETEALIRHFEDRKKKASQIKAAEPVTLPNVNEFQPIDPPVSSPQPEVQLRPTTQEEDIQEVTKHETIKENAPEGVSTLKMLVAQQRLERDISETPKYDTNENREEQTVLTEEVEPQETVQSTPDEQPVISIVDPATLKDLGQMLRSSLKITAETFRPKQTAAISPFRRPGVPLPTSPSAFLDNTDAMQMPSQTVEQEAFQSQMTAFEYQEPYLPSFEMHQQGFFPGMGRGAPFPQQELPSPMKVPGYTMANNPQIFEEKGGTMNIMSIPRMDPSDRISAGLRNPQINMSMPVNMPLGMMQGRGPGPHGMAHQVRNQGVQQFYTGGLDIRPMHSQMRTPAPLMRNRAPPMRNPAPPMIRGMRVPGPSNMMRFQNMGPQAMPGLNMAGPSSLSNMPFPPNGMGNVPNLGQHGMGGVNMFGGPIPFNGNMYPMGRGSNP